MPVPPWINDILSVVKMIRMHGQSYARFNKTDIYRRALCKSMSLCATKLPLSILDSSINCKLFSLEIQVA